MVDNWQFGREIGGWIGAGSGCGVRLSAAGPALAYAWLLALAEREPWGSLHGGVGSLQRRWGAAGLAGCLKDARRRRAGVRGPGTMQGIK